MPYSIHTSAWPPVANLEFSSREDGLNTGRIEIEPQQAPGPSHSGGGGFESCSSSPFRPPYGTAECFLEALLPPAILDGYLVRTGVTVS